jgi:hypothetical protein
MSKDSNLPAIASAFAEYFSTWEIRLPKENLRERTPGEIQSHGWIIRFRFSEDSRGEFLDFYASHRMTNDRHQRLYADGTVEDLEALLDWVVYPPDANEEQRKEAERQYREHNERVQLELDRNGIG